MPVGDVDARNIVGGDQGRMLRGVLQVVRVKLGVGRYGGFSAELKAECLPYMAGLESGEQ